VGHSGLRTASILSLVAVMVVGGCGAFEPETGDTRMACVDADSNPAVAVDFKKEIRPLMSGADPGTQGCAGCHYASTNGTHEGLNQTGLNLETLRTLRQGGRDAPPGVIVAPGKPCSSALVKKLQGTFGDARMPKGGPYWTAAQIQLVIDWIAEGAQGADTD
jgi:hypothetical protein